jgi:hypothetical protein
MCGPPFRLLGSRRDQGAFFSALVSSRQGLHANIYIYLDLLLEENVVQHAQILLGRFGIFPISSTLVGAIAPRLR